MGKRKRANPQRLAAGSPNKLQKLELFVSKGPLTTLQQEDHVTYLQLDTESLVEEEGTRPQPATAEDGVDKESYWVLPLLHQFSRDARAVKIQNGESAIMFSKFELESEAGWDDLKSDLRAFGSAVRVSVLVPAKEGLKCLLQVCVLGNTQTQGTKTQHYLPVNLSPAIGLVLSKCIIKLYYSGHIRPYLSTRNKAAPLVSEFTMELWALGSMCEFDAPSLPASRHSTAVAGCVRSAMMELYPQASISSSSSLVPHATQCKAVSLYRYVELSVWHVLLLIVYEAE